MSEAQIWLLDYLREHFVGRMVEAEYRFHPERKWRFDVAVKGNITQYGFEIEGGIFIQGRHTRGAAYEKDMEKYNTAAAMGWKVFRFTPKQILKGQAKEFLEKHWICEPKRNSLA